MDKSVTLIIPTYNRHQYLNRILEYYQYSLFDVIVADSSVNAYNAPLLKPVLFQYLHYPNVSLTQKLESVFNFVKTRFVVLCADDDFIVPARIFDCIDFLENNKEYSAAQGSNISYNKVSSADLKTEFSVMYENRLQDIITDLPIERMRQLFESYRTIFSAVHYTHNLKVAFKGAGKIVKNLYLNEYLTVIVPIISGKYKELPFLYQVRENAEDSGDKVTDNIDKIYYDEKYKNELKSFITFEAGKIAAIIEDDEIEIQKELQNILQKFSQNSIFAKDIKLSMKKRIGMIIQHIPFLGNKLIEKSRKSEKAAALKQIVKTEDEKQQLLAIESIIKKYGKELSA